MESKHIIVILIYLATGSLFTYFAVDSAGETIWKGTTLAFMVVATLSFSASIRYAWNYIKSKNKKR